MESKWDYAKYQLRMYVSEYLLSLAFKIAPNHDDGEKLKMCLGSYFIDVVKGK